MSGTPAFVLNERLDILAANALGLALYSPIYADPVKPPNNARFTFLDPQATEFFRDWDKIANDIVALLRAEAGRDPYDRQLSDLIGELSTRSEEFRVRWAAHDVRTHTTGLKLSFTTGSWGTSTCRSSPSRWLPIPARASSPTPPSPGLPRRMP
jgi:transcription regulator MmyB-like protein